MDFTFAIEVEWMRCIELRSQTGYQIVVGSNRHLLGIFHLDILHKPEKVLKGLRHKTSEKKKFVRYQKQIILFGKRYTLLLSSTISDIRH